MAGSLQEFSAVWLGLMALALVSTGVVAGVLAGMLGVGGGIVIVPVLYHVFTLMGVDESVRMHVAVGTSLATIVPTSIMSARAHRLRGSLNPAILARLVPPIDVLWGSSRKKGGVDSRHRRQVSAACDSYGRA